MNTNKKGAKSVKIYECKVCDYKSDKKYGYDRHILTNKHKLLTDTNLIVQKSAKKEYNCCCGKKYNFQSSLCYHKKKCDYKENNEEEIKLEEDNINYKELVMKLLIDNQEIKSLMINSNQEIIKENKELRKQIVEMVPNVGNNNNSNNINNIKNIKNKFNINLFLNEKCKDALTMDEFINKIEVSMKNLLTTRDKGLGSGLSNIIIDNMNKLSLYERPMHCTDKKREILYVKNNEWCKDDTKDEINKLIKRVEKKQINNIEKWCDENPKFMESERLQDEYMKIVKGCTSSIDDCSNKVIKNVCDKTYIEKE